MNEVRFQRPDPLVSRRFQDFLLDQQLMKRGDLDSALWAPQPLSNYSAPKREQLWTLLADQPGYLVSGKRIAHRIYGTSDIADVNAGYYRGLELRSNIVDPDSMFLSRIGQGFGVKELNLGTEALETLYCLWIGRDKFVNSRVVAKRLFGDVSDRTTRDALWRLNSVKESLSFDSAEVELADINDQRYFRLKLLTGQPEDPKQTSGNQPPFTGIYSKDYQDWLVEAKVIERAPFEGFEIKAGKRLSGGEEKLEAVLTDNADYIVPINALGSAYYDSVPNNLERRLASSLFTMKTKIDNPQDIFSGRVGWAVGVKGLKLTDTRLEFLRNLWLKEGSFVRADLIGHATNTQSNQQNASDIRAALLESEYVIGSRNEGVGMEYMLIKKSDLIELRLAA